MAYAQETVGAAVRPPRPMERVGAAADRGELIAEQLLSILSRFHGRPEASETKEGDRNVSYLANIERLHGGLDRLEKLAAELAEVA